MVSVAAARRELNSPEAKTARLALHTRERRAVIDDEVVSRVLAEWLGNDETDGAKRQNDCECCPIADVLWMIHVFSMGNASAGPPPKRARVTSLRWPRAGVAQLVEQAICNR
jgi:hypothetical protein